MIPKPLEQIDSTDIQSLVANGNSERRDLDFKLTTYGGSQDDKDEVRRDVTSFANSIGGDIVFGIRDSDGTAAEIVGLPGLKIDEEIRRIESILQDRVEPRVPGVQLRDIEMPNNTKVLVLRVPKSWRGPHFVCKEHSFRMFGRNSRGRYPFDATEIRSAIAASEEAIERMKRWRDGRIASIVAEDTVLPLRSGPKLIFHLVPLATFGRLDSIAVRDLGPHIPEFKPIGSWGWNSRYNLDGLLCFVPPRNNDRNSPSFCQAYSDGKVESVTCSIGQITNGVIESVASVAVAESMARAIASYIAALRKLRVPTPFVVFAAIVGAKGLRLAVSNRLVGIEPNEFDRDVMIFPDVLIESFDSDPFQSIRPILDSLWNAAGFPGCADYDKDGNWSARS